MQKLVVAKVLAGAGIAVAATTAAALAMPDAADEGLTRAEERSGIEELPVAGANAPEDETVTVEETESEDVEETEAVETTDDADSSDVEAQGDGAQGEHGAEVSQLAQDTEPGPDHGPTVAALASDGRSEAGRANAQEARDSHGPEDADEAETEEAETEEAETEEAETEGADTDDADTDDTDAEADEPATAAQGRRP